MKAFKDSEGNYNILLAKENIIELLNQGKSYCKSISDPKYGSLDQKIIIYDNNSKGAEFEKKFEKWLKENEIDKCAICEDLTRNNHYYAGNTPICSQKCLTEWDEDHENKDSEN